MMKGRVFWVEEHTGDIVAVSFDPKINCVACPSRVDCMATPEDNFRERIFFQCQVRCDMTFGCSVEVTFKSRFTDNPIKHVSFRSSEFKRWIGVDVCYILDKLYKRRKS